MTPKQFLAALKRLKWSQRRAAVELDVAQSTVHRWVHGERAIPGPVAVALKTRIALDSCRQELKKQADDFRERWLLR